MKYYKDVDNDSGVVRYDHGDDWIEVEFANGNTRFYRYTFASVGRSKIQRMKQLADAGEGLNAFINNHAKDRYASKR